MRFWIKIHEKFGNKIVAICDEELIGKEFEFNGIKIKIKEEFYKGILVESSEIEKYLKDFNSLNAFGKNIVEELIKRKIINEKNIIKIGNEKHAIVFKI